MSEPTTIPSLKTTFRFPFQNKENRSRFIIGVLLNFAGAVIPVIPSIFVGGYNLRVMRQAIEGEELSLPAWDDWGRLGVDGLRMLVVSFAYLIPGLLFIFGGMALFVGSLIFLPTPTSTVNVSSELAQGWLLLASMTIMFLSIPIGSFLLLLGAIQLPMATAHFVGRDKLAAAFRVREWMPLLMSNKLGYFIAWVVMMGLVCVFNFATMISNYSVVLCCLIPFLSAPIGFYLATVRAALFGETYRASKEIHSAGAAS